MKVCDVIGRLFYDYGDITINEYKGKQHTGRKYNIKKDAWAYTYIPNDILNAEVSMIVPNDDRVSIKIETNED